MLVRLVKATRVAAAAFGRTYSDSEGGNASGFDAAGHGEVAAIVDALEPGQPAAWGRRPGGAQ